LLVGMSSWVRCSWVCGWGQELWALVQKRGLQSPTKSILSKYPQSQQKEKNEIIEVEIKEKIREAMVSVADDDQTANLPSDVLDSSSTAKGLCWCYFFTIALFLCFCF